MERYEQNLKLLDSIEEKLRKMNPYDYIG